MCQWRKDILHQTLVYPFCQHMFFALRLFRLGGRTGGSIADGVFRHGGSLGVHHGLPNNVGHAMLFGSAIGVLLGCLLVDVLGLKRAVKPSIIRNEKTETIHNPTVFNRPRKKIIPKSPMYSRPKRNVQHVFPRHSIEYAVQHPITVTRERQERGLAKMSLRLEKHGMCCKYIRSRTRPQNSLIHN